MPANALSTADLFFYPREGVAPQQIGMLAMTARDIVVREADRAGSHGFVMRWNDAMYPEVTRSPIVLTLGVVNPFAFLPEAVKAGILPPDRTEMQKYLPGGENHQDLASSHSFIGIAGKAATQYLERWCEPDWEGFSTWHALRSVNRMNSHAHLMERRAMPRAFNFFGIMGEHTWDLTVRTALRSVFLPSTVRPEMDWKHCDSARHFWTA